MHRTIARLAMITGLLSYVAPAQVNPDDKGGAAKKTAKTKKSKKAKDTTKTDAKKS